jgi:hypothetical protein
MPDHEMLFSLDEDGDPQFICPECGRHEIHGDTLTVPTEGDRSVGHWGRSSPATGLVRVDVDGLG